MTPSEALAAARRSWSSSLAICVIGLVMVLGFILKRQAELEAEGASAAAAEQARGAGWSGLSGTLPGVMVGLAVAWLVLLGPVVVVLRSYCFRAAWDGRAVEAGSYLKGMNSVWGVLTIGAMLALVGAALGDAIMPGGLVALVATMLLGFAKPDGRALGVK
jgi:hypothetical protein